MDRSCAACGFVTKQDYYAACIECGKPLLPAWSEAERKAAQADAVKAAVALDHRSTTTGRGKVDVSKDLVYWGYFVLFFPFITQSFNHRPQYPEGNLKVIEFHFVVLLLPIAVFAAHLLFFRQRKKIGAIVGIALSLACMAVPALVLHKHRQTIQYINEMHEGIQYLSTTMHASTSAADAADLPVVSYDRSTMLFRQTWTVTGDDAAEARERYDDAVRQIRAKVLGDRDAAKMFMYGLRYEIVLRDTDGHESVQTISRSDVEHLFAVVSPRSSTSAYRERP